MRGCAFVARTGVTARQCVRVRCTFARVLARMLVRASVCGCTCVHGHACGDERRLCAGVRVLLLACWPGCVHACRRAFLFVDVYSSIIVLCLCVRACVRMRVYVTVCPRAHVCVRV